MFVDTSVFIALLTGEPDADALADRLGQARHRSTSPLVRLETSAVLATRLDISPKQAEALFDELVTEAEIAIPPITDAIGRVAVECFQAYGKGRHPAKETPKDYRFRSPLLVRWYNSIPDGICRP